jgi:hypothetical protein
VLTFVDGAMAPMVAPKQMFIGRDVKVHADDSTPLKIAVLGASGRTGSAFVAMALERGYKVRGVCRSAAKVQQMSETFRDAEFVQGDVWVRESLSASIRGCDAVYSFLEFSREFGGCWDPLTTRKSCCVTSTQRSNPRYREWANDLVHACHDEHVRRVVLQSTWFSQSSLCRPWKLVSTGNCIMICCLRSTCGAGMWNGFQMMEETLKASDLAYTIVHCPVLAQGSDVAFPSQTSRGYQVATGRDQLGCRSPPWCCVPLGCAYACLSQRTYADIAGFFADTVGQFERQSVVFQ